MHHQKLRKAMPWWAGGEEEMKELIPCSAGCLFAETVLT